MLQPLQLQDVSTRFVEEIAELRDFLAKSGLTLDTPESLGIMAARLRTDRAFHRDLTSYIWALIYGRRGPIGPAGLLGLLAIAAAGTRFAADAVENDAHDLLRFVMGAQRSLNNVPEEQVTSAASSAASLSPLSISDLELPALEKTSLKMPQNPGQARRHSGWIALAVTCVLALSVGIWQHLRSGPANPQQAGIAPVPSPLANPVDVPSTLATHEASGPAGSSSRKDVVRSALRPAPAAAPRATLAMAGSPPAPAPANPKVAAQPSLPGTAQPSWSTRAPAASAAPPGIPGYSSSRAVPSAVLSRRLGSPSLPAYASAQQDDDAAAPRRPRLLRRSPHASSTLTDGDAELVAEMKVPSGIAPGGPKNPGTTAAPQGIVRPASLGIMAANVVYSPAPTYPAAASAAHVQGEVKVQATVDRDGNVASARVISGPPMLRDAALDAVQRWRYRPYLAGGKPTSMTALAVMDFQLP